MQTIFDAVEAGDAATIRELVAANAGVVRERNAEGATPVLHAQYLGRLDLVEELAAAARPLDIWEAAATGDAERVQELADADPSLVDAFAPDGFYPLALAAFFGHLDVVLLLLDRGADVSLVAQNDRLRVTALHAAAAGDHTEIARALLDAGVPVDVTQPGGFTALHSAAANGNVALVELLREHGADADAPLDDGRTPRDLAASDAVRAALG